MEKYFTSITNRLDFIEGVENNYEEYYQVHILSPDEIYSTYFEKEYYEIAEIRLLVDDAFNQIKRNSNHEIEVSLFEYDEIFIIANDPNLFNTKMNLEYNIKRTQYEYESKFPNIYHFLFKEKIDEYITKIFKRIGAFSVLHYFKTQIATLAEEQNSEFLRWERLREEDKKEQKFKVEIYKIKKDYIPAKITEYFCASMVSVVTLPEINCHTVEDRVVSVVTEIATGKNVDGTLQDAIEGIKHEKWMKKHPFTIDMGVAARMELDENDPNYLSWDDYVANDDEHEEGDDEYSPEF